MLLFFVLKVSFLLLNTIEAEQVNRCRNSSWGAELRNNETTTNGNLKNYSKQGEHSECVMARYPITKRSKGLATVTYATVEAVDIVMNARSHMADGRVMESERAKLRKVLKGQVPLRKKASLESLRKTLKIVTSEIILSNMRK